MSAAEIASVQAFSPMSPVSSPSSTMYFFLLLLCWSCSVVGHSLGLGYSMELSTAEVWRMGSALSSVPDPTFPHPCACSCCFSCG